MASQPEQSVRIRLYLDEDSNRRGLVQGFRARGLDVLTTLEAGMGGRLDEDNLEFATSQSRVLYTYNIADFYELHAAWLNAGRSHAGLILCQQRYTIGEQLHRALKLFAARSAEQMIDRAEFLSAWS
jgi:hypothetical protein